MFLVPFDCAKFKKKKKIISGDPDLYPMHHFFAQIDPSALKNFFSEKPLPNFAAPLGLLSLCKISKKSIEQIK